MKEFLDAHKDWVAGTVGLAGVIAAPHVGLPPEAVTHAIYTIGGLALSIIAGHHWGNKAAEAPKP